MSISHDTVVHVILFRTLARTADAFDFTLILQSVCSLSLQVELQLEVLNAFPKTEHNKKNSLPILCNARLRRLRFNKTAETKLTSNPNRRSSLRLKVCRLPESLWMVSIKF